MKEEEIYRLIDKNSKHLFDLSPEYYECKVSPVKSGIYTSAFSIETDKENLSKLFIKRKNKSENDKDTQKEYKIMKYLWNEKKYSSSNLFCIAEPIHYIQNDNFIATKFIEGEALSKKLSRFFFLSYFLKPAEILNYTKSVSEWLIDYEKRVYKNNKIDIHNHVKIYLDKKIDEIDFIDKSLKSDIKNSLFTLSQDLGEVPCHLVNTDFNPGNILVNKNSTTVIDWEKTEENGLIFWMASTFLRYINRYSGRFGTSRKKVHLLGKSFLHNYLSNSIFKEHQLLFSVIYTLENLTYISETTVDSNKPSRIQKNSLNEILTTLERAKI